jgi:probable F420-dependent oxidoreductase
MMGLSPRWYPEIAKEAEDNGFESVWMPEHLILPATMPPTYPYSESGYAAIDGDTPMFDPWVVLGSVASRTSTIRMSNNIYVLPLRHPFITARAVITLDRISGGRVTVGAGVGWLEEEFDLMGESFANRGARMEEIIHILRRLWSEDVIEHHGEYYDFGPVKFAPKPLQSPNIPIEIGAHGKPALRRAGRIADGWVEVASGSYERFTERLAVVQEGRREAGRENEPFEVTCGIAFDVESVKRCEEIGATRCVVGPRSNPKNRELSSVRLTKELFTDWIKEYADEVISKVN